jgi:MFS family permease
VTGRETNKESWRNVKLLGLVSFLNDLSSEIILPILPFFLTSLNISAIGIGLVAGIIDGFSNVMKAVSGYFSDIKGKRKPLIFAGYALSQFSKLALALSSNLTYASIFTALDRVGKGIRTSPRDALIAESASLRGKAFGFHRAMDTLGAVLGTVIAIVFIQILESNYKNIILIASLIGFLSLIPLAFVFETARKHPRSKIVLGLRLRKFLILSAIFGLANISYMFFILRASQHGVLFALTLYLLFNIVYAVLAYPIGSFSDKVGKQKVAAFGYAMLAIAGLMIISGKFIQLILAFLLFGVFMASSDAVQRSIAAEVAKAKGFGIGAFHFVFGMSTLIGNVIYGFILQYYGFEPVFLFAALMAFISSLIYILVKI